MFSYLLLVSGTFLNLLCFISYLVPVCMLVYDWETFKGEFFPVFLVLIHGLLLMVFIGRTFPSLLKFQQLRSIAGGLTTFRREEKFGTMKKIKLVFFTVMSLVLLTEVLFLVYFLFNAYVNREGLEMMGILVLIFMLLFFVLLPVIYLLTYFRYLNHVLRYDYYEY